MKVRQQEIKEKPGAKSISHALEVLSQAAEESSDDLRAMVKSDYQRLQDILSHLGPALQGTIREVKNSTVESIARARDKAEVATRKAATDMNRSAHDNPWIYIGAAAVGSALLGFILARRSKGRYNSRPSSNV